MRSHEKRRAKLALADEDCQYDGVDHDEARSPRKNYCGTMEIQWWAHLAQQENTVQDAQKGRPARPQRAWRRRRTLGYVELLSEARTPLADFFSILLE